MSGYAQERALDRIVRLARRHQDLATFWRESSAVINSTIPNYQGPCWFTMDPASLLVTSHFNDYMPHIPSDWWAQQYYQDDVNKLADVARSSSGISTLHEATNGDPSVSARWHSYLELGADQELVASLRTKSGKVWGALSMYREPGRPLFDSDDQRFIQAVTPHLATAVRRAMLVDLAISAEHQDSPGLIVLSESWEVESTTPGVERWLTELPDGDWEAGKLPSSVLAVAGRARRTAENDAEPLSGEPAGPVRYSIALISAGSAADSRSSRSRR
jgi:GAF domain-containing protein